MGILDLEALKRQGQTGVITEFKKGPSGKEKSHWVRLRFDLLYGGTVNYFVTDYGREIYRDESFEEAAGYYESLYLKYKG